MARYRHYDLQQTKMIAVYYGRQLLAETFEHALSDQCDNEIDLDRLLARLQNVGTGGGALQYPGVAQGGAVRLIACHQLVTYDGACMCRERGVHCPDVQSATSTFPP